MLTYGAGTKRRISSTSDCRATLHALAQRLAIVGPHSMHWPNGYPVQGGWRCMLFWNRQDCRHGGYGRGMPPSRRRTSSKDEVTPGAPASSGVRNAGIATWRTPIGRQRCRGCEQTSWGRIKPSGRCVSRREIGIPIDAGVGESD
jgi:hypothetical protein